MPSATMANNLHLAWHQALCEQSSLSSPAQFFADQTISSESEYLENINVLVALTLPLQARVPCATDNKACGLLTKAEWFCHITSYPHSVKYYLLLWLLNHPIIQSLKTELVRRQRRLHYLYRILLLDYSKNSKSKSKETNITNFVGS